MSTPLTVLGGYLGAGKTALLNRLLKRSDLPPVGVLVNDFGAINIDAELITNRNEEVVSLANGCICCNLEDGLLMAALRLVRREPPPEQILIETSGVADPVQVAHTFEDPELQPYAPLDGVVTVVDAELGPDLAGDMMQLARRQVAAADVVVLNKTDLVEDAQRERARGWVQALAPGARLLEVSHGRAPLELILGIGGVAGLPAKGETGAGEGHSAPPFDTCTFVHEGPLSMSRLHDTLRDMPKTIFRAKGVVNLIEKPDYPVILQFTGSRATMTVGDGWSGGEPRTRIVFIGTPGGVDESWLSTQLTGSATKQRTPDAE